MPSNFFQASSLKIFSIRLAEISDNLFLVVYPNFSLFRINFQNFTKICCLDAPPVLHHAPVKTLFSFLVIYLPFFTKTGPLDASHGGCPRPSHRPHPPLHATVLTSEMASPLWMIQAPLLNPSHNNFNAKHHETEIIPCYMYVF